MQGRDRGDFSSFDRPPGAPDYSGGVGSEPGRYSRDLRGLDRPATATGSEYGDYSQRTDYPTYSSSSSYDGQYGQDDDLYEDEWYEDDNQADQSYGGAHARALDTVDDGYDDTRRRPELGRPTADDYADAYYDDYEDEYEEEGRRGRGPLLLFVGLAAVGILAAGLIVYYLQSQQAATPGGDTPRVAAPSQEPKTRPQVQPPAKGTEQTKLFYDRIVGDQTIEGERIQPREEQPLDPGGSVEPQPLQPVTPDQLDSGELPVPLPPPLPGGTSGSLQPSNGQGATTNVAQTGAPANQSTVAQASGSQEAQPAGLTALPLPGANTLPDGSDVSSPPADTSAPATTIAAANTDIPRPRAKPRAVVEAAQRTRVASVAPITAAPTEPLAITPLPGSEPRTATPAPAPALPQPAQPLQPSFGAQQTVEAPSVGQNDTTFRRSTGVGQDDASFSRPLTSANSGQQVAAVQPSQQPAPAPAPSPTVAAGAYVVQLASYKDQTSALAGFQDLRARHPSLLGRFQPLISKKTVGAFGTFYRLQVGPIANQQAGSKICASLLAAGEKDCLVKQR